MEFFTHLWDRFVSGFPDIIVAVLYLAIAFVVALLAKTLVSGILKKVGAEKYLEKTGVADEKSGKSTDFIGKIVFLIVFLLFLPAVLTRLGMTAVAAPISNTVSVIINYLPTLLAAAVVLYIGVYVAKIIRQLVKTLLKRIGLDKLQSKMGVTAVKDEETFTGVLSGIVYVFILIPVIIVALQILGLHAVANPATLMLNQIFAYLPSIFVALLLLIVGYQLAKLLAPVIESLLVSVGLDKFAKKAFPAEKQDKIKFSVSKLIGQIVRWLIMIIFFIEAVNLLRLEVIATIGAALLGYLPFVVSAIIIMGGGIILASWIERLIAQHAPQHKTLALITKVLIIVVAGFMTVSQLGFAQNIVNIAFIVSLSAAAVAFAIAFGVGGRVFAANRLAKLEKKLDEDSEDNT